MLENPLDRIKLLRAGFTSKTIEKLYIEGNNFKLIRFPIIVELAQVGISWNNKSIIHEVKTEFDVSQKLI